MRKRIREKGFTLIELLVTIVIIGILSVAAIVGVQKLLSSGRDRYYNTLRSMIIASAEEYFSNNKKLLPVDIDDTSYVTLGTLQAEDYIDDVKDANGDQCDLDNTTITVIKQSAKDYEYILNLSCPDPKMKDVINESNSNNRNPEITFSSQGTKKKVTVSMCVNGRTDYTYELMKKETSSDSYKVVKNRKGNIKSNNNCININLDQGSGIYKVRGRSGDTVRESYCLGEDYCEAGSSSGDTNKDFGGYVIEDPYPTCEGIDYQVNKLANTWFSGDLIVNVTSKNKEKYHVDHFTIEYGNHKSGTFYGQGREVFSDLNEQSEVIIRIYNEAGDEDICSLGDYYSDNIGPTCVNAKENNTWTNSSSAFVSVDCEDFGSECKVSHIEDHEDGQFADVIIEDQAGNQTTCRLSKMIDREGPSCKFTKEYYTWGDNNDIEMQCVDETSGCTQTNYKDTTEGKYSEFTVTDKAGNQTTCTASKFKDNSKPKCEGFNTTYEYIPVDPNDTDTDYIIQGFTSGVCKDTGSGCVQDEFLHYFDPNKETGQVTIRDKAGHTTLCPEKVQKPSTIPHCPTITLSGASAGQWTNGANGPITATINKTAEYDYIKWPSNQGNKPAGNYSDSKFVVTYKDEGQYGDSYYELCKNGECLRKCKTPNILLDTTPPTVTGEYTVANTNVDLCPVMKWNINGSALNFVMDFRRLSFIDKAGGSGMDYWQIESAPIYHFAKTADPTNYNFHLQYEQAVRPDSRCPDNYYEAQVIVCETRNFGGNVVDSYFVQKDKVSYSTSSMAIRQTPSDFNYRSQTVNSCLDWNIAVRVFDRAGNVGSLGTCSNPAYNTDFSANCPIGIYHVGPFTD